MAADWLKWVKGLTRRREIVSIASAIRHQSVSNPSSCQHDAMTRAQSSGRNERRVIAAACMEFWEWADAETTDGSLPGVSTDFIDDLVGIVGFSEQMMSVGWLTQTPTGLEIAHFERHNGDSAKRRAQNAAAQQRRRDKRHQLVINMSSCQHDEKVTREEKRREEKNKEEETPLTPLPGGTRRRNTPEPSPIPDTLDTPEFRSIWETWRQHRVEKRQRMTSVAETRALAAMAKLGLTRALAAIEHSIAQGYTGIHEPGTNGKAHAPKPDDEPYHVVRDRLIAAERARLEKEKEARQ